MAGVFIANFKLDRWKLPNMVGWTTKMRRGLRDIMFKNTNIEGAGYHSVGRQSGDAGLVVLVSALIS